MQSGTSTGSADAKAAAPAYDASSVRHHTVGTLGMRA